MRRIALVKLVALYQHLAAQVALLDARVEEAVLPLSAATRLMTHPGVGPVTASATEVFLGDPGRSPVTSRQRATAAFAGSLARKRRLRQPDRGELCLDTADVVRDDPLPYRRRI
jgi:transposase